MWQGDERDYSQHVISCIFSQTFSVIENVQSAYTSKLLEIEKSIANVNASIDSVFSRIHSETKSLQNVMMIIDSLAKQPSSRTFILSTRDVGLATFKYNVEHTNEKYKSSRIELSLDENNSSCNLSFCVKNIDPKYLPVVVCGYTIIVTPNGRIMPKTAKLFIHCISDSRKYTLRDIKFGRNKICPIRIAMSLS